MTVEEAARALVERWKVTTAVGAEVAELERALNPSATSTPATPNP
jgi:hypothetical protein